MEGGFEMWTLPATATTSSATTPDLRKRVAEVGGPAGFEDVVASINPIADDQPDVPAHWSVTFAVDDADAVAEKATELGGKVVVPPFDAPWVRMTVITDPQGATFIASKFVLENKDLGSQADAAVGAAWGRVGRGRPPPNDGRGRRSGRPLSPSGVGSASERRGLARERGSCHDHLVRPAAGDFGPRRVNGRREHSSAARDRPAFGSVEMKITARAKDEDEVLEALERADIAPEAREVYFVDTTEPTLFEAGIVLRARLIHDGADDSTVSFGRSTESIGERWKSDRSSSSRSTRSARST